jgi:hypothetical protein
MLQVLDVYCKSDEFRSVLDHYSQLSVFVSVVVVGWNDLNNIPSILRKEIVCVSVIFRLYNNMQ